jgi:hypothetical protein
VEVGGDSRPSLLEIRHAWIQISRGQRVISIDGNKIHGVPPVDRVFVSVVSTVEDGSVEDLKKLVYLCWRWS